MIKNEFPVAIYVAGPYTSDPEECTKTAIEYGNQLRNLGFYPFIPHLFHFWEEETQRHYEDWFDMDLEWLSRCDCLIRIPGESSGADREVNFCIENEIPVFHSVKDAARVMLQKPMGRVFCLVGPSGVGKTTLQMELYNQCLVDAFAVSTTTREIRPGEEDGVDYKFVSEVEFEALSEYGELIEEAHFYGNSYGLELDEFFDTVTNSNDTVVVVNREGLENLRELWGDKVFGILVLPPTLDELRNRLNKRPESKGNESQMDERLKAASPETLLTDEFDLVVVNDDLQEAVKTIGDFVKGRAMRIEVEDE